MELKKRIGQLLVIGYQGLEPSAEFLDFVAEWGVGGIIFFTRNIGDIERIPLVVTALEKASGQKIFTAIDQEGGLVLRILKTGSLFPGAMALAATGDLDLTRRVSKAIGQEMQALGLNWNLAPVLDINHAENPGIGARSFGETPEQVAKFGKAAIAGFQDAGILACAKHFPGKGHARVDSHLSLPVIPYDRERLFAFELYPFTEAIKAGVDAVMTSHVYFPAIEPTPNLPGTLSKNVLTGLLRQEMGFKGLLITDDLEMGAITEAYGVPEAARLSFLAGSDLMLICHDLKKQRQAAEAMLREVGNDEEGAKRLEESLVRIAMARAKLPGVLPKKSLFELSKEHQPLIEIAYQRSVQLVKSDSECLPLHPNTPKVFVCPEVSALVQVEETQHGDGIIRMIGGRFPDGECLIYHPKGAAGEILEPIMTTMNRLSTTTDLIVFSYNAHLFSGQQEAFKRLAEKFPKMVLVALRNPYDLILIPQARNAICTYGFRSPAMEQVLDFLTGKRPPNVTQPPVNLGLKFCR